MARRKTSTTAPHTITAIPQLGTMKSLRVTGSSVVDSGKAVDSSVVDEGIEGISVDEVDTVFVSNEHNISYSISINIDIGTNKCMLLCDKTIICYDINIHNM